MYVYGSVGEIEHEEGSQTDVRGKPDGCELTTKREELDLRLSGSVSVVYAAMCV